MIILGCVLGVPPFKKTPKYVGRFTVFSKEKKNTKTGSTVEGDHLEKYLSSHAKNLSPRHGQDTSLTGQWTTRFYQPPCRCWELVGQKRWQQIACQESRRGWQKYFQAWQNEFKYGNWVPKTMIVKSKGW